MLVIEILYEMMFRALLLEENVDSERGPILSEKQMRNTIGYRRQLKMMNMMPNLLLIKVIIIRGVVLVAS